jgi:hypothetical protein
MPVMEYCGAIKGVEAEPHPSLRHMRSVREMFSSVDKMLLWEVLVM